MMNAREADAILGPINREVLYAQPNHCSTKFWREDVGGKSGLDFTLRVRHLITGFHQKEDSIKQIILHPRVISCLYDMGFGGVYSVGETDVDASIITALVERWRPETHTFHLPVGEATVTLQDVAILWGLPITGRPVTGQDMGHYSKPVVQDMCDRFLGFRPEANQLSGLSLKLSALKAHLKTNPITDESSDLEVVKTARCAILRLISMMLCPDSNGDFAQLIYLYNLGYFDWTNQQDDPERKWVEAECSSYSWGSAVLANLYSELCKASRFGVRGIGGAVQLLVTWLTSRIRTLRPKTRAPRSGPIIHPGDRALPPAPWGHCFVQYWSHKEVARHNVRQFRDALDRLTADEFLWNPYDEEVDENVWLEPRIGKEYWHARVPLIDWETVEMYYPERVLRQFGIKQKVPIDPINHALTEILHNTKRRGHPRVNWADFHRDHVDSWNNPIAPTVEENDKGLEVADDYFHWYNVITRRKITPPDGFGDRVNHDTVEGFHPPDLSTLQTVKDLVTRMLNEYETCLDQDLLLENARNSLNELDGIVKASLNKATEPPRASTQIPLQSQRRPPTQPVPDIPSPQQPEPAEGPNVVHEQPNESPRNVQTEVGPPTNTGQTSANANEPVRNVQGDGGDGVFSTASTSTSSDSKPPSPSRILTPSSQLPQIPITWPDDGILTVSWVTNLMQAFEWASGAIPPSEFPSVLSVEVFNKLVLVASKILHKEPNCVKIDKNSGLVSDSRVVVVGDVHGQLHDVLFLLRDAGFPGDDRFFVFNGDYVDRGAWGLEVFLLLLAWKVLMPHRVYMLRGNHESKYCTSVYGFEKEVLTKYGDNGKHVYRKCLGCFEGLPLASIIAEKVYTAHGGLFRGTVVTLSKRSKKKKRKVRHNTEMNNTLILGSLEELATARRTVLDAPWEGPNLIPGDVLWSDPSKTPGLSPNIERGIGLLWGPDCTEDFLKKNNLKMIIRSHEGPDARDKRADLGGMDLGYTIDHIVESGKLITLFSAPDYPQFQATEERYRNKGAYIILEPPYFDAPIFHSFSAVTPRPKVNPYYDFEDVIDSDEELDMVSMVPESGMQQNPAS